MPYCLDRRGLIMTGVIFIFACLLLYGVFGAVSRSTAQQHVGEMGDINNDQKELQLVHLVFRHGPRTPADTYPYDPYLSETFEPNGWGQLTNAGKKEVYETGKWLRKRYENFLGPIYKPDFVHAQATGVSRTHMTLALVLAGLWPPKNTATEWNKNLNWQPIPIYSEELDKDTLLLVRTPCPRYYEALEEVYDLPEVKKHLEEYRPIFEKLTNITGMKIATADDVQSLYSTLRAESEFGLKLPAWTNAYYPEKLLDLAELSYIYSVYTEEMKRRKGGPFLQKMFNEWIDKTQSKLSPADRKIYLYTGHDSTISNILGALDIWEKQIPVYGIMGIFELYKDRETNEYEVQIYLRNSTTHEPHQLTIPGCSSFSCPLNTVLDLAKSVLPSADPDIACRAKSIEFTEPPPSGP